MTEFKTKPIRTTQDALAFLGDVVPHLTIEKNKAGEPVVRRSEACQRCGGSGNGGWFQDGGVCYECGGIDTRNRFCLIPVKKYAQNMKRKLNAQEKKAAERRAHEAEKAERQLEGQRNWCESQGHGRLTFAELDAKRAAERAVEVPEVEGRVRVEAKILAVRYRDSQYGEVRKLLLEVEVEGGSYKLWGTAPSALSGECDRLCPEVPAGGYDEWLPGRTVAFTARVERSEKDPSFGFYSRPTKVTLS